MTNDEAIYVLKNTAWLGNTEQAEKVSEAVRMAVEALKTQLPKEDITSDCISRQEAIRIASGYCHFTNVAKELEKLPSVRPVDKDINVSCKDAISRQGAIDHFKSIADATSIGNKYNEGFVDGLNFAVGHLETMPSVQPDVPDTNVGDLISRQVAIDICHKNYDGILDFRSDGRTVALSFEDIINSVPSVQPGIIHCRDCISYQEGIDINGKPFTRCNGSVRTYGHTLPDWYCADAERRTDGRD